MVLCEDTRRTQVLLDRHGIRAQRLVSFHRHNEARRVAETVPRLVAGERLALVSDAGLPGVNDPGARLVEAALAAGVEVTVLPGPSAVETALVASGLAADAVPLPRLSPTSRGASCERCGRRLARWPYTAVAFESPRRLPTSLALLREVDPGRNVAVCRELTKRFEEVVRGTADDVASRLSDPVKGEVTVVLAPAAERHDELAEAVSAVHELVGAGAARRTAAEVVAQLTGVSRNALYRASLDSPD